MTFATVYCYPTSSRSNWLSDLGDYVGLKIVTKLKQETANYKEIFPLNKAPALITPSGYKLTETIAIFTYIVDKSNKKEFLGITEEEKANNLKWLSFMNSDFVGALYPLIYFPEGLTMEEHIARISRFLKFIENELKIKTTKYLSSDEILISDIFTVKTFDDVVGAGVDLSPYPEIVKYMDSVRPHPLMTRKQSFN